MVQTGCTPPLNWKKIRLRRCSNDSLLNIAMTESSQPILAKPALTFKTKVTPTDTSYHLTQVVLDTDSGSIGVDNRCTACISHDPADFVGELQPCAKSIKGFGGTQTPLIKQGTLLWKWEDDQGLQHKFLIPNSFYVPSGKCRLLSPQHWAQTNYKEDRIATTSSRRIILTWGKGAYTRTMDLGKSDNVGTFRLSPGFKQYHQFCVAAATSEWDDNDPIMASPAAVVEEETDPPDIRTSGTQTPRPWDSLKTDHSFSQDHPTKEAGTVDPHTAAQEVNPLSSQDQDQEEAPLTIPDLTHTENRQEETAHTDAGLLLQYHYKYGHISFARLRRMAQQRIIPYRLRNLDSPACAACLYGKAKRRPWRGPSRKNFQKTNKVHHPGQVVSVDQLVSPTPGFIAQMTGILTTKRYRYATVYVDHYSKFSYLYLQKTATAEETVEGKRAFERHAAENGIKIEHYHADNGIFRANAWVQDCLHRDTPQAITYAGVDAHHANGMAESRIKDLQDNGLTMILHAAQRWVGNITTNLWPYALRQANMAYNNTPLLSDPTGHTPMQLFTQTEVQDNPKHWQPFGCPTYVLKQELRSPGGIHHKWQPRSIAGIYLGKSPIHSHNVALVLNRDTGLVSPQFHVQFDPLFSTTADLNAHSLWQIRAGFASHTAHTLHRGIKPKSRSQRRHARKVQAMDPFQPPQGAWGEDSLSQQANDQEGEKGSDNGQQSQPSTEDTSKTSTEATSKTSAEANSKTLAKANTRANSKTSAEAHSKTSAEASKAAHLEGEPPTAATELPPPYQALERPEDIDQLQQQHRRRSKRKRKPVDRWTTAMQTIISNTIKENVRETEGDIQGEMFCYKAMFPREDTITAEQVDDPITAYKASTDPDTMYMHQAMKEPDRKEFQEAMVKEVTDQLSNGNFSLIKIEEVPRGSTILPCVWQMKRKRDIQTRQIKKYKARLNVDGSRMKKGIHYDRVYSPVAGWASIRMLLILVAINNWHTMQIDYVQAFPQAPVEKDLYMKVPAGFKVQEGTNNEYALKLHKNVYGQKQAGRVWYRYLTKKLIKDLGFIKSTTDECVFYRGNIIYVLYTDDSIIAGPDREEIQQVIADLKTAQLEVTVEGTLEDFLGVHIKRETDGSINLTQPHLAEQIVKDLGVSNPKTHSKPTPAKSSKILFAHKDSADFDESFHYRSVVGKLNYLEKSTRPDLAYAAHQCARFSSQPKKEHGEALRWIGRYLKANHDKGLILKPTPGKGLEVHVDADFAGNWNREETENRDTARSRHGFVISYEGCPVIWKSSLQTEIALSSTESEYTGLSYALREAIPLMRLLQEMKHHKIVTDASPPRIHCRVYEDNSGALEMAREYKYRPRTKFLNIKLHHFRDYVERGDISIHKIGTEDQPADYMTKPLDERTFVKHRKVVQGW